MNRIRLLTLCVVAAFATSAVAAASAAALAPEFGRCLKLTGESVGKMTIYHGRYSNSGCTTASAEDRGKYEWYPGVEKAHFTTEIKEGTGVTFQTAGKTLKTLVTCTGETSSGEYAGPKLEEHVVLTLTGCEANGDKASSEGAAAGEVIVNAHECELGVVKKGETTAKNMIGLTCGEEPQFAWIKWGGGYGAAELCIKGWWFFSTMANRMRQTSVLRSAEMNGRQKLEKFEEGPLELLESTLNGDGFEQIGLKLTTTQTNEEAVEVNSVV